MGLELYPSAENAMLASQNTALESWIDGCRQAETALACFAEDTSLAGQAYESAKELVSRAAIPAVRGLAALCRAHLDANTQVAGALAQYPWAGALRLSEAELRQESDYLRMRADELAAQKYAPLFEPYLQSMYSLDRAVQERISQMHAYNIAAAGAYTQGQGIQDIALGVAGALGAMEAISFDAASMAYTASGIDWSFESRLAGIPSLVGEAERTAIAFYRSLPPDMRGAVSIADIEGTADGFALCSKPLDQVLADMGITGHDAAFYESLYLFGLRGADGGFVHSVVNMRLPGQSSDAIGISVPFRSFDIGLFEGLDNSKLGGLKEELDNLLDSRSDYPPSDTLLAYFANPKSEGSYLIVDIAIARALEIAGITGAGIWNPGTIPTIQKGDPLTTDVLKKLDELGIVNLESGTVAINNAASLTYEEKCAILACITSSPDPYAYAAENQFHADLFINRDNTLFLSDYIGPRAVISDAGPGESVDFYEPAFKKSAYDVAAPDDVADILTGAAFSMFNGGILYYDQQVEAQAPEGRGGAMVPGHGDGGFGGGGGGAR